MSASGVTGARVRAPSSPSKRTRHHHTSPTTSPTQPPHSPSSHSARVLRTKLSMDQPGQRECSTPPTPPSPASPATPNKLVGLGLGVRELGVVSSGGETQTVVAEQQQRVMSRLPLELHNALAKLSSQHRTPF